MTAPEELEDSSPNTFTYDNAATPEYSGFSATPEHAPPIVDTQGSFQSGTYPLRESDLLDTGTTLHICNRADRFTELYPAQSSDGVFAGKTWVLIKQRGTRVLEFHMGKDRPPTRFTLRNIAYIPGYHTNLVLYCLLQKKGYWLHGWENTLVYGPPSKMITICRLLIKYEQYILQYAPILTTEGSFGASLRKPKPERERTAQWWHLRTGHIRKTALEQLANQVTGVRIKGLPLTNCADCSQASRTQIIVHRLPESKVKMPFQRVRVDLFFFPPAYNGHKMAEIFNCEFTGLVSAVTMGQKSSSFEGILNYEARLERQFGLKVNIYRLDSV